VGRTANPAVSAEINIFLRWLADENMTRNITYRDQLSRVATSNTVVRLTWCRFEGGTGSVLFIVHRTISRSTFDLDYILSRIERIQNPGPAPDIEALMPSVGNLKPSKTARDFKSRFWARKIGGLAAAGL